MAILMCWLLGWLVWQPYAWRRPGWCGNSLTFSWRNGESTARIRRLRRRQSAQRPSLQKESRFEEALPMESWNRTIKCHHGPKKPKPHSWRIYKIQWRVMTSRYKSLFFKFLPNKTLAYLGVWLLRNCQCYCQATKDDMSVCVDERWQGSIGFDALTSRFSFWSVLDVKLRSLVGYFDWLSDLTLIGRKSNRRKWRTADLY